MLASLISACGGTGGSLTPSVAPSAPKSSGNVTTSTTSTVTLPTLQLSGITVDGTLPTASIVTSLTETITILPPPGITALLAQRAEAAHRPDTSSTPNPIAYLEFTSNTAVTLNAVPSLSFALSQIVAGDSYYLAFDNATGWIAPFDGPAAVSGTTVTFASIAGSILITPAQPAVFALYDIPTPTSSPTASPAPTTSPSSSPTAPSSPTSSPSASPTASPSAAPTATPTPVPTPTPVASPDSFAFDANNPGAALLSVSETGDTAPFNASIACTEDPLGQSPATSPFVAMIGPPSATPSSAGAAATFKVASGSETGSCTITIIDANGAQIMIPVTVSSANLNVFDVQRR